LEAGSFCRNSSGHPRFSARSQHADATTGVYHEYDLKRTLILLNYNERQVLLTVSKQIGESSVGKRGAILGNDNDWSYYYSEYPVLQEPALGG